MELLINKNEMITKEEPMLGFIKYHGELVEDGFLDARKSGEVLLGLDEFLRYFIYQENPSLREVEFEIPVKVRKGSWETIIPDNIEYYKIIGSWMIMKYGGSALSEIAKNDFKDVSLKDILKKALANAIEVIKLSKHLGTLTKKKFENVQFAENNDSIGVVNSRGDQLWISSDVLELYSNCPASIFSKVTKIIEEQRELIIGLINENKKIEEQISYNNKAIFSKTEDEVDIVLPELVHGKYVELKGRITRGNEKSNTIGFLYEGHIITCYPDKGNVKTHKSKLFNNCLIKGYVDRMSKEGTLLEKRPRIKFIEAINLEQPFISLFSE